MRERSRRDEAEEDVRVEKGEVQERLHKLKYREDAGGAALAGGGVVSVTVQERVPC